MDWEANLAAIIKCTDASLAQQFRQYEDVSAEFSAAEAPPQHEDRGGNVAAAYLRETMASDFCHRQQQERENEPTPTYSRVSGAFTRGSAAAAPATSSFSEHFHRRQERKRGATATARMKDNQRLHHRGDADYGPAEDEVRVQDHEVDEPRYANPRPAGGYPQMYSSPTYDMAQMMEQVRLSLKLEVDARAAIAERQLSALVQLCKATSEELDRLRVEVCANDRQLHTLDQVQSKIRQELTTQKDIGFHLQSMCGKDESWRMQTENQLLELRQMVAALREQGNSTQAVAQEKLSRSELLVQFNAAMEPIKAQLQANLQHQAQQIADITRTTSSSSLLLDGLTQKVNRSITDEVNELRSDLNALKHHVAKMDIFQDGGRGDGIQVRSPALTKEEHEAKTKEKRQQQENKLNSLREDLVKELTAVAKDYVDSQIKPIRQIVDENGSKFVGKQEMENMQNSIREGCQNRCAAAVVQVDSQIRSIQDQLRGENNLAIRDCCDQLKQSIQQTATGMKTALEGQSTLWQSKQHEVVQMIEKEKTERKQAWDEINESLRKNRHQLEDKIHTLTHESHTKLLQHGGDFEKRLKEIERQFESSIAVLQKESQVTVANLNSSIQTLSCNNTVEWEQKLKRLEETVSGTNLSVAALSKSVTSLTATSTMASSEPNSKDVSLVLEKQTNVYVSTMENLLKKMQLQLQLQSQSQVQMTMAPSPFHGYWPPSPYAATQLPPAPTLHLPASIHHSSVVNPEEYNALPAVADIAMHTAPTAATSNSSVVGTELNELAHAERSDKNDKSADRLNSPMTLHETVKSNSTLISDMVPSTLSTASSSTPKALVQNNLPKSEQTPINLDETNKWQHTLATTAKGALAEAELAKARVESRRKQESETKQHRPLPAQEGEKPSAYMSNSIDPVEPGCRRSSVPIAVSGQTSVLTRSASSSALPEKGALANTALEDSKPVNSAITAGNHSVSSKDATSRPSASAQSTLKAGGNAGAPILPSSQGAVKNNSKPLATNFSAGDPSHVALKGDLDSAGSLQLQSVSKEDAHSEQSITVETQREAQQKEAKDFTLSVPNVSDSSAANNEQPPPLSPLAKLFARPTAVRAAAVNGDDVVPVDLLSTGNVSETTGPTDTDKAQLLPALPAVSADNPPVSHVLCALCRIPVRSDKKVEHEHSQCPKRMVECVSCKEQMQWVAHEMHELECNSTKCNQSSVADTRSSLSEAKGPPDVSDETELGGSLKKCRHCSADVPSLDLLEHEINCDKVLKQCPHCLRRQKMSELQDHIENCDCRLVSCPNDCGGKFLQRGIPNHLATRCPKKQTTPAATSPPSSTDSAKLPTAPPVTRSPSAPPTAEKVECKFCDDEIESSRIDEHEQNCDWKPKRCQHCNMVVISRDLQRHETSCKTNMKACPHCNENMLQSALPTHAGRCSKRPIKCIRCCQLFPADAIVAHSTNCKFVPGTCATANSTPSQLLNQSSPQHGTAKGPIKIPPPPPFPPPSTATTPVPASQLSTRRASADPRVNVSTSSGISKTTAEETAADRLARRNLALSQLTNPDAPLTNQHTLLHDRNSAARLSAPSLYPPTRLSGPSEQVEDEEEDDEDEEASDDEDDQLTLAQVVREWSVENVCLWLREDVGVPDVVLRFQQMQCNGEMLLELTESDLINDFGVKDRIQRERILNAIEAINTSSAFSDEDEDDDEEEEDDEDALEESEEYDSHRASEVPAAAVRHSIGGASYGHPRDILRRKSQPSPSRILDSALPSSNDMLRRISSALENPKR